MDISQKVGHRILNSFFCDPNFIDFSWIFYFISTGADYFSSFFMNYFGNFYETNFISGFLGFELFSVVFWVLSIQYVLFLYWFQRYVVWSHGLVWIPIAIHFVCFVHNVSLVI